MPDVENFENPVYEIKRQAVLNPENTFFLVKSFIGRKMPEDVVEKPDGFLVKVKHPKVRA